MSVRTPDQAAEAGTAPAASAPPVLRPGIESPAELLQLQRTAGNRATGRVLARLVATWGTQAQAQATATATATRLQTQLLPYMARHSRRIVRNTAELFTGASPLLTMQPITKRPDSAAQLASPTAPAWANPATHAAFFTGTTMTNVRYSTKNMIGTLDGTVMHVRGHFDSGGLQSLEDMAETVVHECSHFFVSQYGELPQSDANASSYDRYADEFRAYWVEGRVGHGKNDRERAAAIREHLVGTAGDPTSGYPQLHAAYFAAGPNPFRTQVDALGGPVGFNLENSIRLHNLWQVFREQAAGTKTVQDIVFAIARLPAHERREAAGSSLIRGFETAIGGTGAQRIRAALTAPTSAEYTSNLNPRGSQPINVFLGAVIIGDADRLKRTYEALPPDDRRQVMRNPAFMSFVDHHQLDTGLRAAIFAMTETWQTAQFDRMLAFLATLRAAKQAADAGSLDAVPADVTEAMGRLHMFARWTLFSWGRESAMREYVDVLPPRIAAQIREALRA